MKRWFIISGLVGVCVGTALAVDTGSWKAAAPIQRMVFVGDSITVGIGTKDMLKDRYPALVVRELQSLYPGVTEINQGRSGNALCQQPEDYYKTILAQNPDAVVIQWGVNDHFWGYSVHQFNLCYDRLVASLRQARPRLPIVVSTLVPDYRWPETQERWIAEANVAIHETAVRYGCHLAQIHEAINHNRSLQPDGIHPNNAGAAAMARAIVAALTNPPLNPGNLAIHFDQSTEVRYWRYSFLPHPERPTDTNWVQISKLSRSGMIVSATVPLTIRTEPFFSAKHNPHQIVVRDAAGAVVESSTYNVGFSQTVEINLKPGPSAGPLRVEIVPAKELPTKAVEAKP